MALPNVFNNQVSNQLIDRIKTLSPNTNASWGKMNVGQMLAHCNVTYEMVFEDKHPKPGAMMKWIMKMMVKDIVVNEKAFKHNSRTAPQFLITNERIFEQEQKRLIDHISKTQALGTDFFEQKESHSFGKLTATEWNNMFYKHLDHHLTQFGV
ncbi:MAG: DUF1569 domain-containing protein [Chitinophagaceae bacterium]|nr:DUF1569 domain-containing protein [Chitinophagaceae bacterium]